MNTIRAESIRSAIHIILRQQLKECKRMYYDGKVLFSLLNEDI